jgi:hypothetical protein
MNRKKRSLTGINIQFPISQLILSGKKTIETRTYQMPASFLGREIAIIETPGRTGSFKARIIGTVIFGHSFKYKSKITFYEDIHRHAVTPDSPWKWSNKPKWGWPILKVTAFQNPIPAPRHKGIRYTNAVEV